LSEAAAEPFAASVRAVLAESSSREAKLWRARETAQQYSWESVTARFFELYDELYADFPTTRFARKLNLRSTKSSERERETGNSF